MNLSEVRIHYTPPAVSLLRSVKNTHRQFNSHIQLLNGDLLRTVTLQRVLDKDQRCWLQVTPGCYSIPGGQIVCRNPQWCEYWGHNSKNLLLNSLSIYCIWLYNFYIQQKYKEEFEKTKGRMIGLKGLEGDINIAHSVHATKIQSDVSIRKISRTWCGVGWSTEHMIISLFRSNTKRTLRRCFLSSICPWTC